MAREAVSLVWVAPFVAMLLGIAILPLAVPGWWDRLRNKLLLALALAAPVAIWLLANHPEALAHSLGEYLSFVILLGSLYVVSGGILLEGDLRATPGVNTAFLLAGTVLANLIGTTGASMLLIRPVLRTNLERRHIVHVPIFFIFLVANIGGCLTPLADPPLFLGFLRGVPFTWTLRLWPPWLFTVGGLLLVFYSLDLRAWRKEARADLVVDRLRVRPLRIVGGANFLGLLAVLFLVVEVRAPLREAGMVAVAALSYFLTSRRVHEGNHFGFHPIQEVAILFLGIFVTMVPALTLLELRGGELGIERPAEFFWATGTLSAFLDNAPTYLTFTSLALGTLGLDGAGARPLLPLATHVEGAGILRAISLGAVFMGAMTYIGNGPNFMVKAICDARGVRMPSFFGYMRWSAAILVPLFLLLTALFLRS